MKPSKKSHIYIKKPIKNFHTADYIVPKRNTLTQHKRAKSHCQLKLNNASRHFNNIFFKIQVLHSLSEFFEMAVSPYDS